MSAQRPVIDGRTRAAHERVGRRVRAHVRRDVPGMPLPVATQPLTVYAGMDVDGEQVLESLAQLVEQTLVAVGKARTAEETEGVLLGMAQNALLFGWELAQDGPE